jgi:DNA-binding NarL/FixJ family response regulator
MHLRVGVFDTHEIFRRGVIACLSEDDAFSVLAEGSAAEIDVAVSSSNMLDLVPLGCPVVMCADTDGEVARRTSRHEVFAILPRSRLDPEQLNAAIRAAAAHLHVEPDATHAAKNHLDDRTRAVLQMVAEGMATKEISSRLGYSERTIKAVLSTAQRDMGTRTRAQTTAEAVRRLLI